MDLIFYSISLTNSGLCEYNMHCDQILLIFFFVFKMYFWSYVLVFCQNEYSSVYHVGGLTTWKIVTENEEKVSVLRLLL